MSIVLVKAIYDLAGHNTYVELGRGEKRRNHLATSTDRFAPGSYVDASSPADFVKLGQQLARGHGRKVEALGYVLSFAKDELSVDDDDDLQRVGDLAYLLAKKMHPHSRCMVAVHSDSGGAAHAHVAVLNNDFSTGKALRGFRTHWQTKNANDALMHEWGMRVIEPETKQSNTATAPFDDLLRARIFAALEDSGVVDWETFDAALAEHGVDAIVAEHEVKSNARRGKKKGDIERGVTFRMRDEVTPGKPRIRRRKGSALGREFCFETISAVLATKASKPVASTRTQPFNSAAVARSAQARSAMSGALGGVLAAGLFVSVGGWQREALKVGIRVIRDRSRVDLRYRRGTHEFAASELGDEFSEPAILSLANDIAALRERIPVEHRSLPVADMLAVLAEQSDTPPQLRRRPPPNTALAPARARFLELHRGDRSL